MLYEPDLMDSYAQHTNPEAVANSINAAQVIINIFKFKQLG
jgi:hypothetical protein